VRLQCLQEDNIFEHNTETANTEDENDSRSGDFSATEFNPCWYRETSLQWQTAAGIDSFIIY